MLSITDDGLHYHREAPVEYMELLVDQSEMAQSQKDDFVVALQSGVYDLAVSSIFSFSHPEPFEVLVWKFFEYGLASAKIIPAIFNH